MTASRLSVLAALALASACGGNAADFTGIIPDDGAVTINVPGQSGGQPLLGARSDFYETTYNISRGINGGVTWVLGLTRAISLQRPSKVDGDQYTWGPSQPSGLDRIQWKFEATKVADGHWTFQLLGRPKNSTSEADYKAVYDGEVFRGADDPARGHGSLNLYFDNSQALEQKSCGNANRDVLEGRAVVAFAADVNPRTVSVDFVDFRNACDGDTVTRQPAHYDYTEAADGAGNFQFSAHGNVHKAAENKPLLEKMAIRSRWMANGAGRSDVSIGEGEVPGDLAANSISGNAVIATECWDEMFNVSYQTTEPTDLPQGLKDAIRPTEGNAADCVFTQQELPDVI
ncbi:MAG: hypothetical protein HY904_00095 [Deltaproteobacteria bacterium]|nr:hypothetical protein [Deltaproteobacteria bacterium]